MSTYDEVKQIITSSPAAVAVVDGTKFYALTGPMGQVAEVALHDNGLVNVVNSKIVTEKDFSGDHEVAVAGKLVLLEPGKDQDSRVSKFAILRADDVTQENFALKQCMPGNADGRQLGVVTMSGSGHVELAGYDGALVDSLGLGAVFMKGAIASAFAVELKGLSVKGEFVPKEDVGYISIVGNRTMLVCVHGGVLHVAEGDMSGVLATQDSNIPLDMEGITWTPINGPLGGGEAARLTAEEIIKGITAESKRKPIELSNLDFSLTEILGGMRENTPPSPQPEPTEYKASMWKAGVGIVGLVAVATAAYHGFKNWLVGPAQEAEAKAAGDGRAPENRGAGIVAALTTGLVAVLGLSAWGAKKGGKDGVGDFVKNSLKPGYHWDNLKALVEQGPAKG